MNSTLQTLSSILNNTFGVAPDRLSLDASLAGLNIDSLGLVELLWQVEEVFGVSLPPKPPQLLTLGDVVRFIDRLVADAQASTARIPVRPLRPAEATAMPHPSGP